MHSHEPQASSCVLEPGCAPICGWLAGSTFGAPARSTLPALSPGANHCRLDRNANRWCWTWSSWAAELGSPLLSSTPFLCWVLLILMFNPQPQVLDLVELTGMQQARVGLPGLWGLSQEQRRRLSIAVELAANPSLCFLE